MADRKKQHWVPRTYLEEWIDPTLPGKRSVWVFNKDGTGARPSKPEQLFHSRDLYTRKSSGGARDLSIEEMLGRIETTFPAVRRKLQDGRALTTEEQGHLCVFAAALHSRSLGATQRAQAMFLDLKTQLDQIIAAMRPRSGPEDEGMPTQDPLYGEIEAMAHNAAPDWVAASLELSKILARMRVAVLRAADAAGRFITSDSPCALIDPEHNLLPPFFRAAAPNLGAPKAWLTLPLSPRDCLLFSWSMREGWFGADADMVSQVNRFTCGQADRWIVANSVVFMPEWLPPASDNRGRRAPGHPDHAGGSDPV